MGQKHLESEASSLWCRPGELMWAGVGLTLVAGWLALRDANPQYIPDLLVGLDPLPLVLAGAIVPAAVCVKALQWRLLSLAPPSVRLTDFFTATGIGLMVNSIAPARMGDLLRPVIAQRLTGLGVAQAGAGLVIERLLDLVTLAALALALTPFAPLAWELKLAAAVVASICSVTLIVLVVLGKHRSTLAQRLCPLGLKALDLVRAKSLESRFGAVMSSTRSVTRPRRLVMPVILSGSHWLLNASIYALVMVAFGLQVPLVAALVVLVFTNLGMALPSAPGHLGVFDYLCVLALVPFGIEPTIALTYALVIRAYGLLLPLVVGLLLVFRHPSLRSIVISLTRAMKMPELTRPK